MNSEMLKKFIDKGVLFLCVANSARSQMAEGLARQVFGDKICFQSAGSKPAIVNPIAIEVMREIGIDISSQCTKSPKDIDLFKIGMVVMLCVDEICPSLVSPGFRLHWFMPNPAVPSPGQRDAVARFRATRDELKKRIEALHYEYCLASLPRPKPVVLNPVQAVSFFHPFRRPVFARHGRVAVSA